MHMRMQMQNNSVSATTAYLLPVNVVAAVPRVILWLRRIKQDKIANYLITILFSEIQRCFYHFSFFVVKMYDVWSAVYKGWSEIRVIRYGAHDDNDDDDDFISGRSLAVIGQRVSVTDKICTTSYRITLHPIWLPLMLYYKFNIPIS